MKRAAVNPSSGSQKKQGDTDTIVQAFRATSLRLCHQPSIYHLLTFLIFFNKNCKKWMGPAYRAGQELSENGRNIIFFIDFWSVYERNTFWFLFEKEVKMMYFDGKVSQRQCSILAWCERADLKVDPLKVVHLRRRPKTAGGQRPPEAKGKHFKMSKSSTFQN